MYLSILRDTVHDWFKSKIRVDAWTVNPPSKLGTAINGKVYPANTAMKAIIRDITIDEDLQTNDHVTSLIIPYAVQYRFSGTLAEHSLPLRELEALYSNTVQFWLRQGQGLNPDIIDVTIAGLIETPVSLTRSGEINDDWLVILLFEFQVKAIIEPEAVPSIQPSDDDIDLPDVPFSVHLSLWRSTIDDVGNPETSSLESMTIL